MANSCYGLVDLIGSEKSLNKITELLEDSEKLNVFFEKVLPVPKELIENPKESNRIYGDNTDMQVPNFEPQNSYEWIMQNWGAKWTEIRDIEKSKGKIELTTESAWSPPIPFFKYLSKRFKLSIELRYIGQFNTFIGRCAIKNGIIYYDESSEEVNSETLDRFGFEEVD